jgi:hypothetical protein
MRAMAVQKIKLWNPYVRRDLNKGKNMVCASLILLSLMLAGQSSAKIDEQSIAAIWLFDEGSGEIAGDSSGNGRDGTIISDPEWVKGKFGKALEFDGIDDMVDILYTADDQNDAYTVMCWVKLTDKALHTGHRLLAGRSNGVPQLWAANTGKAMTGHKMTIDQFSFCEGTTDIPVGQWIHLAGTFDGTTIRVYVNGKEQNSLRPTDPAIANMYTVQIGGFDDTLHGIRNWSGCYTNAAIDEVALLSVALTANEIKSVMENGIAIVILDVSPAGSLADTWGRIKSSD